MSQHTDPFKALAERVILVTGSGQGLGRAVALACASAGATVVLLGRNLKKLEAVYDEIEALDGPQPAIFPLDLATALESDLSALAQAIQLQLQRLDGLVHCAVHLQSLCRLEAQNAEQWEKTFRVNLLIPALLTRACLPLLKKSPQGTVVFTSESHAGQAHPFWGAFSLAAGDVLELARLWQAEQQDGSSTAFYGVVPGPIDSPLREKTHPGELKTNRWPLEPLARQYVALLTRSTESVPGETLHWRWDA